MKKKHHIGVAVALALGLLATALGITYEAHTPITDVSITGTLSNGTSVPINTNHTMTCSTSTDTDKYCDGYDWHYPSDPVTHTWSGAGAFNPTTGTSVTWTSPNSTGSKTLTVTANDSPLYDETAKTDSISVTVVKVAKIQYNDPDTGWTDAGTLYVHVGTTVQFKAIPDPGGASWPNGKPVWGGTSGASGTGATTSVTFNTLSTSTSDYKTVTAECGNTVTVNVIVYDFEGVLSPAEKFDGRSLTSFGIAEDLELESEIDPTGVTPAQVGGLRWSYYGDNGTLSNVDASSGTADYRIGTFPCSVFYLVLTVDSGPSSDSFKLCVGSKVFPSGSVVQKSECLWHNENSFSIGLLTDFYLSPKNVSFANIQFKEGQCTGTATGWFVGRLPSLVHDAWDNWYDVGEGNIDTGCKVLLSGGDEAKAGPIYDPFPYADGVFYWNIPWLSKVGAVEDDFDYAHQEFTVDETGRATVQKGSVGPHAVMHGDDASVYCP
jgi:hypothetical protein